MSADKNISTQRRGGAEESLLEYIFKDVIARGTHGNFLKCFARAYVAADEQNQRILFSAAIELLRKYDLHLYLPDPPRVTFLISPSGDSITCLKCGMTSWHLKDVDKKYCGHCNIFHEDARRGAAS